MLHFSELSTSPAGSEFCNKESSTPWTRSSWLLRPDSLNIVRGAFPRTSGQRFLTLRVSLSALGVSPAKLLVSSIPLAAAEGEDVGDDVVVVEAVVVEILSPLLSIFFFCLCSFFFCFFGVLKIYWILFATSSTSSVSSVSSVSSYFDTSRLSISSTLGAA